MKKRVTGIGGIFFKVKDPNATKSWYQKHLGLNTDNYGTAFEWRSSENPEQKGFSQWSPMKEDTTYFKPSEIEHDENVTHWHDYPPCEIPCDRKKQIINT
ncbi:VOC family protein [Algoriphagus sp.]|uniref:VOC family protein n=1 Tax=Algoriphagus sp. TaxID=1872435 RepID=UPI0035240ACC